MSALSRLGQCCGRVNIAKGEILVALRAYLDSSGKLHNNYLTLAALAATDEMWGELETAWDEILRTHTPKGEYVHMREVLRLIDGFDSAKGWDHNSAFGLVNKCLIYMSRLDKTKFHMFYCAVDLAAWRKLRAETYEMPEPIQLCNEYCTEAVLGWLLHYYPGVINLQTDTVKYFFDRNEYFESPFKEKWNREKNLAEEIARLREGMPPRWNPWQMIEEVGSVEMKRNPGIQAADIIAWGVNREQIKKAGELGAGLANLLRLVIPAHHIVWDEENLRKHFKPLIYFP